MIFSVEVTDKSTLFAMLHPIVGDDVCMIRVTENQETKSEVLSHLFRIDDLCCQITTLLMPPPHLTLANNQRLS